jgi:hypothetical protein
MQHLSASIASGNHAHGQILLFTGAFVAGILEKGISVEDKRKTVQHMGME